MGIRVGVDVGGTFTKAVAVSSQPLTIHAHASVPTTHTSPSGVAEGVAAGHARTTSPPLRRRIAGRTTNM